MWSDKRKAETCVNTFGIAKKSVKSTSPQSINAVKSGQSRLKSLEGKDHSAANPAVIRHVALNLIKTEKTSKVGVKIKRLKAG